MPEQTSPLVIEVLVPGVQGPPGGAVNTGAIAETLQDATPLEAGALLHALAETVSSSGLEGRRALQLAIAQLLAETIPELGALSLSSSAFPLTAAGGSEVAQVLGSAAGSTLALGTGEARFTLTGTSLIRGSAPIPAGPLTLDITETNPGALGSPRTTTLSLDVVATVATTQIATSATMPVNRQQATSSSNNRVTAKFFRNGRRPMRNIRLVFANTYLNSIGQETNDLGALRVWGSLRLAGSSTHHQVTFEGTTSATLAAGGFCISDPIPNLTIPAGAGFFAVTADQCAVGAYRPTQYYLSTARGEAYLAGASEQAMLDRLAGTETMTANGDGWNGFGPVGILGEPADGMAAECVVVWHDSIGDGTAEPNNGGDADGNRGYIRRGFAQRGHYCWTLGRAGGTLATTLPGNAPIRRALYEQFATAFIDQLGENSLSVANSHLVYEDHVSQWKGVRNIPAIGAKVLVKSASTDSWMTSSAQTVGSADQAVTVVTDNRPRFNLRVHQSQMLSAGQLHGLIDAYPMVVSPSAADKWNSPAETASERFANDAIHPTTAGHIAMTPAVTQAIDAGLFT